MSQLLKVQLEDEDGNIYYLRTSGDSVFLDDGRTVQAAIEQTVRQSAISNVQVNDSSKVPSAALAYAMQQQITENEEAITGLNSKLINGSGLGLTEGMYSIYAPNTADDMVYPGLYRVNGITVGSRTNFYGFAIVMSSLDHTIIKQLIYHNASGQSILRYRFNNQWADAGEFALKNDLADRVSRLYSNDVTIDVSRASGSASPWTYTATGLSCQTGDQIIVGYLPQSTASADKNAAKAYGYLAKAECTTNGQLKLTFLQAKPATDFKIRVLSFRTVS